MNTDERRVSFTQQPNADGADEAEDDVRRKLQRGIHKRCVSLSDAEAFFLHALLVDPPKEQDETKEPDVYCGPENNKEELTRLLQMQRAATVLDDDVLFSVPEPLVKDKDKSGIKTDEANDSKPAKKPHHRRPSKTLGLWQAHEEGVFPKSLSKRGSLTLSTASLGGLNESFNLEDLTEEKLEGGKPGEKDETADDEVASDQEVRRIRSNSSDSGDTSWDEGTHREDFSAWEILKDEYAKDFGFHYTDYKQTVADVLNDSESHPHSFKILGTSAEDESAQPHVLSPPLMDSLMNFLPVSLIDENYWLKFSLVRDGASLETLKQYSRGSKYTVLAIETRNGDVFGVFASESWRNNFGFYGSGPAFVWKMRFSRNTKCSSLFDQAQLESEIDVYQITKPDEFIQLCRHDSLAVGGDSASPSSEDFKDLKDAVRAAEQSGFALALEDDLLVGTTSPSATFSSPSLCGRGDRTETFEVANLEVWTFTPCMDVRSAQSLELSKFFIEESVRTASSAASSTRTASGSAPTSPFSSREIVQERFYQRLGEDFEGEERRQRWQYLNTMDPSGERGIGATPRFT